MTTCYRIKDWDSHFENNKSRERDQCSFVCVPNKQHGLGFSRIMSEPDGATIYGVWHLIVGMCSRQHKPREGWLTHNGRAPDGHQAGTPLAPKDLALLWRRPVPEIERTLEVVSSQAVDWMEVVQVNGQVPAECPSGAHEVPAECPRREEKRREGREGNAYPLSLKVAERISHEGELKRVIKEIEALRKRYGNDEVWEEKDRVRIKELKARQAELRTILGVVA